MGCLIGVRLDIVEVYSMGLRSWNYADSMPIVGALFAQEPVNEKGLGIVLGC